MLVELVALSHKSMNITHLAGTDTDSLTIERVENGLHIRFNKWMCLLTWHHDLYFPSHCKDIHEARSVTSFGSLDKK